MLAHYYRYNNIDNKLNLLPHHEINYQNNQIKYTYDKYGQITEKVIINENNQQIEKYTYTYNSKNMLTNEYYEDDLDNGYTIHYTYDDAGNVVSVTKKDLNNVTIEHKSFAYSNNKLTTFTKNGLVKTFSYNTNDELVSYGDNSLIWNEGKLSSFGNLSFEYDSNGRRTKKRIGNEQNVEYLYDDNKIIRSIKNNQKVDYLYDINDKLIGFKLLNNNYFYEREITGIITDIVDESGNSVVKYKYDGFGNLLSATGDNTIIDNNIFLYKGYCYDVETGWFWLSSRYYSPELCRFISPDDIEYLDLESFNGLNLYCYCYNNPISYYDPSGHSAILVALLVGAFVGGVIGGAYGGLTAAANDQNVLAGVLIGIGAGALMGAGAGVASLYLAPVIVGQAAVVGGVTYSAGAAMAIGSGIAFGSGFIGGMAADALTQVVNDGGVKNLGSLFVSGFQWGLINTASAFLGSLGGPVSTLDSALLSGIFGSVTSAVGMTIDILRNKKNQKQKVVASNQLYAYGF